MPYSANIQVALCVLVLVLGSAVQALPMTHKGRGEDNNKQGPPLSDCNQFLPTNQPFLEPFSFFICLYFTASYSG